VKLDITAVCDAVDFYEGIPEIRPRIRIGVTCPDNLSLFSGHGLQVRIEFPIPEKLLKLELGKAP
jgi:hypothetical protein